MLLKQFCRNLSQEYAIAQILDPEFLAKEFSNYFEIIIPPFLEKNQVLSLCEGIGLGYPEAKSLPEKIRGIHYGIDHKYVINYREDDWDGAVKHTIFHEIYEIILHILSDHVSGIELSDQQKETNAHKFAAAVLMPQVLFFEHCIRLSYDPIELRDLYDQAYLSIMLRMAEVLNNHTYFIGLIAEKESRSNQYMFKYRIITQKMKSISDFFSLPIEDSIVNNNTEFGKLALKTVENKDSIRNYRITHSAWDGLYEGHFIYNSFPLVTSAGNIYKLFITGIEEKNKNYLRSLVKSAEESFNNVY